MISSLRCRGRGRFDPAIVLTNGDGFKTMTLWIGTLARKVSVGLVLQTGIVLACAPGSGAVEKLVDPSAVAPEYRAAAEKRRAEQVKLLQCTKKADDAKVLRRDRVTFINECIEN